MTIGDITAILALIFSVLAMIISIITSTKKYELASLQRSELLDWHQKVLNQLMLLREYLSSNETFNKTQHLANLSALIDCGRFFFPNLIEDNKIGKNKPSAYQGRRDQVIEYLVQAYILCKRDDAALHLDRLEEIQREFTSLVFSKISPYKFNKMIRKYTDIPMDKGTSLEELQQQIKSRK